jgi:2-dehydropantoate 2-reductase
MGAGAIGGYVGGHLTAAGEDVSFIARGPHLEAMRRGGLRVESGDRLLDLPAVTATNDPMEIGAVDLVLFTVKLYDTEEAARSLAPLVAKHTRVLTLQNGIDSVDLLSQFVPRDRIIQGVIYLSAVITSPGHIKSPGGSRRVVVDRAGDDPVVAAFREAGKGGLDIETTDAIHIAMWEKFIRIAAFSGASTLMRSRLGPIMQHSETRAFLRQLVEEGIAIAVASGCNLDVAFADATMAFSASFPPGVRSSMAEDLERGKRLELNWLSGRLHALGITHGVPTPAHSAVYRGLALYANGVAPT